MSEDPSNRVQSLWQDQPVEPPLLPLEEIRTKATKFQWRIRLRNLRAYVGTVIVVGAFGSNVWSAIGWLEKTGDILVIAGAIYFAVHLYTRGGSTPTSRIDATSGVTTGYIQFHRSELERQRDLLRNIWRWYLGPLIPGLLVLVIARFVDASEKGGTQMHSAVVSAIVAGLVFVGVWFLNARGARKLQREIDTMPAEATEKQQ